MKFFTRNIALLSIILLSIISNNLLTKLKTKQNKKVETDKKVEKVETNNKLKTDKANSTAKTDRWDDKNLPDGPITKKDTNPNQIDQMDMETDFVKPKPKAEFKQNNRQKSISKVEKVEKTEKIEKVDKTEKNEKTVNNNKNIEKLTENNKNGQVEDKRKEDDFLKPNPNSPVMLRKKAFTNKSSSKSKDDKDSKNTKSTAPKSIQIFYDAMHPESKTAFLSSFMEFLNSKEAEKVDVELIPGGLMTYKATDPADPDDVLFECPRYGQNECVGNIMHACALNLYDRQTAYNYIACYMNDISEGEALTSYETTSMCAGKTGFDFSTIRSCAEMSNGKQFMIEFLRKKENLSQEVFSSPWIVVDGVHNYSVDELATQNLSDYVDKLINGPGITNGLEVSLKNQKPDPNAVKIIAK